MVLNIYYHFQEIEIYDFRFEISDLIVSRNS